MQRIFEGRTVCCIGTGPSLTQAQIQCARDRGWPLFVCNDAIRIVPDAALLFACNWQWWDCRWPEVKDLPCEKWTTRRESADKYGIHYIEEHEGFGLGLSEDPAYLYHGHSSGFQLLGMAYRARPQLILLLGYDLKFPEGYDGLRHIAGGQRHFFGEYSEPELQHWPRARVRYGVHEELVELYGAIPQHNHRCEIVNCSPGSALTAFPMMDIDRV